MKNKKGQMIVEYAVMFAVIVAVILYASFTYVRPALNRFFNQSSKIIDNATNVVATNY